MRDLEDISELMLLKKREIRRWSVRRVNMSRVESGEFLLVQQTREMEEKQFFGCTP